MSKRELEQPYVREGKRVAVEGLAAKVIDTPKTSALVMTYAEGDKVFVYPAAGVKTVYVLVQGGLWHVQAVSRTQVTLSPVPPELARDRTVLAKIISNLVVVNTTTDKSLRRTSQLFADQAKVTEAVAAAGFASLGMTVEANSLWSLGSPNVFLTQYFVDTNYDTMHLLHDGTSIGSVQLIPDGREWVIFTTVRPENSQQGKVSLLLQAFIVVLLDKLGENSVKFFTESAHEAWLLFRTFDAVCMESTTHALLPLTNYDALVQHFARSYSVDVKIKSWAPSVTSARNTVFRLIQGPCAETRISP